MPYPVSTETGVVKRVAFRGNMTELVIRVNGARHVFVGEIENLFQLFPIKNFFERQRFHGRARDDHAVEMFVSDVVEFFVKAVEMCRGGIFTLIGIGVQERDVDLQRRIGQKAHKLRFRFHFRGHEIQNSDFKRTG